MRVCRGGVFGGGRTGKSRHSHKYPGCVCFLGGRGGEQQSPRTITSTVGVVFLGLGEEPQSLDTIAFIRCV